VTLPGPARPRVLHITAELDPLVKVGGLGEAVAGLVGSLPHLGWDIEPVLPDYGGVALTDEQREGLPVPSWAGEVWARRGRIDGIGPITLIASDHLRRPHPYVDPATGESWPDNDRRFLAFAAGAAALADLDRPDLIHAHDWHAAPALCLADGPARKVLSIHNLAHQGLADESWIGRVGPGGEAMRIPGACDPLVGGVRRADAIVTVSPTYRREICTTCGEGVAELLVAHRRHLVGIVNGIDRCRWDPATDPRIPHAYDRDHLGGKERCHADLLHRLARARRRGPVVAIVSRMARQKGIDLALAAADLVAGADGLLVIHGSGQRDVTELALRAGLADRRHVAVVGGYDETTAHRIMAGADILLMPSRFEPCGLTQLQAMTYGTIPVVTDVGGLHDTVVDDDANPGLGTGFVARSVDPGAVRDAMTRAITASTDRPRWHGLRQRAMTDDWGWGRSARRYDDLYRRLLNR
jgi:starch synthase